MSTYEENKYYEENENTAEAAGNEEPEASGNGVVGKIVTTLVVGGLGAFAWVKTKGKREKRAIRNLEKKGYIVMSPDEVVEECDTVSNEDEKAK